MRLLSLFVLLSNISLITALPNFILFGPPGSGKNTFSLYCVQEYGYHQVCPGDLYRDELNINSDVGKRIRPLISSHVAIDKAITRFLVTRALEAAIAAGKPFIINAYVMHTEEFAYIYKFLKERDLIENTHCVYFEIDNKTCIERMHKRQSCSNCHAVFNKKTRKPKHKNKCDFCGHGLSLRSRDLIKDHSKKRLANYRKNIEPLIKKAKNIYVTTKIDATKSLIELQEDYDRVIAGKFNAH